MLAMRQDYFIRFGQQLLAMHAQDADSIAWSDVHDWLADAPKNVSSHNMELWTDWMGLAIANGTRTSINDPQLVACLGDYLDRLLTIPGSKLAEITTLKTFESLMRWITPSSDGPHPSMGELVASGWSPAPLMQHIEDNRDAILRAELKKYYYPIRMRDTGAGEFYRLVHQVVTRDTWVPEKNPNYGLLFEHYSISDIADTEDDARFIRNVLLAAPGALGQGLHFARLQEFFKTEHLDTFFPMVLSSVDYECFLDSLVALVVDEPEGIKGKTMPLLNKHHPELAQLLAMHLSIFPDAKPGCTYAELLVEPYLRMLGPKNSAVHEAVNLSVFDSTDCSA